MYFHSIKGKLPSQRSNVSGVTSSHMKALHRVISVHRENSVYYSVKTLHLVCDCVLFSECKCFNCPKCSFVFQEEIGLNFSWPELM